VNYDRDKKIDLNNLHFEWMRQVDLIGNYETAVAEAKFKVDQLEEAVKVEEALAGDRVRTDLAGQKFTVDMVRDRVTLDPTLRSKKEDLDEAIFELNLCRAAAKSIDTKKSALEAVVELWKKEYFSTPFEHRSYDDWTQKRFSEEVDRKEESRANQKSVEVGNRIRTRRSNSQ
jgi:hypothetical protein